MELKVEKRNAIKAWKEGNAETKKALENLYGKEVFNQKITDIVKTFEYRISANSPVLTVRFLNTCGKCLSS